MASLKEYIEAAVLRAGSAGSQAGDEQISLPTDFGGSGYAYVPPCDGVLSVSGIWDNGDWSGINIRRSDALICGAGSSSGVGTWVTLSIPCRRGVRVSINKVGGASLSVAIFSPTVGGKA